MSDSKKKTADIEDYAQCFTRTCIALSLHLVIDKVVKTIMYDSMCVRKFGLWKNSFGFGNYEVSTDSETIFLIKNLKLRR